MKRLILTLAAVTGLGAILTACETPTPYQPLNPAAAYAGGYSEEKVNDDLWQVTFSGNSLTSRDTVESYLLYRAAELTVAQGFDWFEPVDRHTDKKVDVEPGPGFYGGFGYGYGWRPYWRHYGGGYGWRGWDPYWGDPFFDASVTQKYEASTEIVMGHGPKPADDRRAMDAREVMTNLRAQIVTPK